MEPDLKYFITYSGSLDNKHKLVLSMRPDEAFAEKEQADFDRLEERLRAQMTEEDKGRARAKCLELLHLQSQPENAACLPTLQVKAAGPIELEFADDKSKCMDYEPFEHFFKGLSLYLEAS
jgi:Zn-dependent M16 (insulinase) family peptidase